MALPVNFLQSVQVSLLQNFARRRRVGIKLEWVASACHWLCLCLLLVSLPSASPVPRATSHHQHSTPVAGPILYSYTKQIGKFMEDGPGNSCLQQQLNGTFICRDCLPETPEFSGISHGRCFVLWATEYILSGCNRRKAGLHFKLSCPLILLFFSTAFMKISMVVYSKSKPKNKP